MTLARPSSGDIIASAWGDAVADSINTTLPRGVLGVAKVSTSQVGLTVTDITGLAILLPSMVVGRRLRVTTLINFYGLGSWVANMFIYMNGTQVGRQYANIPTAGFSCAAPSAVVDSIAGNMLFKVAVGGGAGGNNLNVEPGGSPNYLLIEDIGVAP